MRRSSIGVALGVVALAFFAGSAAGWTSPLAGSLQPDRPPAVLPALGRTRDASPREYVPGEVIVVFKRGTPAADRAAARRALGATADMAVPRSPSLHDTYLWHLPPRMGLGKALGSLRADPRVKWAQPNYVYDLCSTPDDPDFGQQWGLHNTGQLIDDYSSGMPDADIDAPEAWDIERGFSSPVVVAVIDTGVDLTHPDLQSRLWTNTDEVAANGVDDDGNGYVDDVHGYNWIGNSTLGSDSTAGAVKVVQTVRGFGSYVSWAEFRLAYKTTPVSLLVKLREGIDGTVLASATVPSSALTTDLEMVRAAFGQPVWLANGTKYALEVELARGYLAEFVYGFQAEGSYGPGACYVWDGTGYYWTFGDMEFLTDPSGTPADDNGHGTHVAGTVAAASDNQLGVAGVSHGAHIMGLRFGGMTWGVVQALHYAADNGAGVVNMSFGHADGYWDPVEHEAIAYAAGKGVVLVGAAGNEAEVGNPVCYPGAYDEVVCVAATDNRDARAAFSTYNQYVDVAAPGVNVLSTVPTWRSESYDYKSGTSMASPHVAGLAALILAYNPYLTPAEVRAIIEGNVQDLGAVGRDDYFGKGRINAYWSLLDTPPAPWPSGTNALNGGAATTTSRAVTLTSDVTFAREMRYAVGDDGWGPWQAYRSSGLLTLPDVDAVYSVRVQYRTVTYRVLSLSDTIVLDRVAPTVASVTAAPHADPNTWYANNSPALSWTPGADTSGVIGYSYGMNQSPTATIDTGIDTELPSRGYRSLGDGQWYFHVRACDAAGNWGPTYDYGVKIDTTAPTGTVAINGGAALTNSTAAAIASAVTDTYTPTASLQMRWSTDGGTSWSGWAAYGAGVGVSLPAVDGTREVRVQYRDLAGNTVTLSDTIVLDTAPPTIASLSSSTHPDPARWYTRTTLDLAWTPAPDATGVTGYSYELDFSPSTTPDTVADGTDTGASFSSVAPGQRYFHVRARDAAGNWGSASHYGVKIDTAPPSGTMEINGGDTAVNDPSIVIGSMVTDDFTPAASLQIRYSLNGGVTWSGWQNYSEGIDAVLPDADGVKSVACQYRDLAGNVRQYAVDIWLDRMAPDVWDDGDSTWSRSCTLQLLSVDLFGCGVRDVSYQVDGRGWTTNEGDAATLMFRTWKRGGNSGIHTVEYRCSDWAGNTSPVWKTYVRLDARPPTTIDDLPRDPAAPGLPVTSTVPLFVTLNATDPLSSVAHTRYSLDGAGFVEGTWVFIPVPDHGSVAHWLGYYSVDEVGNTELVRWVQIIMIAP